jgi:hypothetical protein
VAEDQDWRLQAELDAGESRRALGDLLGRLRGPNVVEDVQAAVSDDVVITHDGKLLFAYAPTEAALRAARGAIEEVLRRDGVQASIRMSHWDDERDLWRQTDPPLSAEEQQIDDAAERDADETETRTMVASSGRFVRGEFEQSMLAWAEKLGLQCAIIEHPHLLTTQVGFTVTGPKRRIDEFSRGLKAEGWAATRTETAIMLSPL